MFKKRVKGIVFLMIGLFLISSIAIASSSIVKEKTSEELFSGFEKFKERSTTVNEADFEAWLEEAKQWQKVLSQLGIQRTNTVEATMTTLEERIETLQTEVSLLLAKVKKLEKELSVKPAQVTLKNLYRVKKGDTLWDISGYRSIYNDPFQWKKIYETNKDKIKNPDLIYPGQRLFIPPKTSHQVLKGENLWSISNYESIYNDPFLWKKIYETNKDKIKDPDFIYPGQRLIIPQE